MLRPDDRRLAELRRRTGLGRYRHVHRIRGVIDDGSDRQNLGQRVALRAEIIDDARLGRAQVAGGGGVARLESDDPGRKLLFGEFRAGGVQDSDRAEPEQRAGLDLDDDRGDRAVAIAFGGAREGRDVARADRESGAIERDRGGCVVVAVSPQSLDHRNEIAHGPPRQRVAVGGSVLAQLPERRSVLHRIDRAPCRRPRRRSSRNRKWPSARRGAASPSNRRS